MLIGVPREIKVEEKRVALVPGGAEALAALGHKVLVETGAGLGSGFDDVEYAQAGAEIAPDAQGVYRRSDMVLKVKEPLPVECRHAERRPDPLHLSPPCRRRKPHPQSAAEKGDRHSL